MSSIAVRFPRPVPRTVHYRLTLRGKVVVLLAGVGAALALMLAVGQSGMASDTESPSAPVSTVVVRPGQTLWDIASRANPEGDIRDTVRDIVRLNALTSAGNLQIGTELSVPIYNTSADH